MTRGIRWLHYDADRLNTVSNMPGCYAIFTGLTLLYIGQSDRVRERLTKGHGIRMIARDHSSTPWGDLAHVTIRVRYDTHLGDRLRRELRLCVRLRPVHNSQYVPPPRYRERARWKPPGARHLPSDIPTVDELVG